jgi:hypothetical protein
MEITYVQLVLIKALNFGGFNKATVILLNNINQIQKDNSFNLEYDIYMGCLNKA